jgi:gas vesicle protein
MDNFTKKKIKKPKELVEDIKSGDFSVTKREFDLKKSKKTVKELSKDGKRIKGKIDQLKEVHEKLVEKDNPEKRRFIERKMPGKR